MNSDQNGSTAPRPPLPSSIPTAPPSASISAAGALPRTSPPLLAGLLSRRKSLRTQLIAWNILTLALLFAALGVVIHYTVRSFMMGSVDHELKQRIHQIPGPPPRRLPPQEQGRPPEEHPPFAPDEANRNGQPFPSQPGGAWNGSSGQKYPPGFDGSPRPDEEPGGPPPEEPENFYDPNKPDGPAVSNSSSSSSSSSSFISSADNSNYRPQRFDRDGKALAPDAPHALWDPQGFHDALDGKPEIYSDTTLHNEPLRVLSVPFPSDGPIQGVIQVPYPVTEVNRAIADLNRALLMLIPVCLLFAGIGGAFLTDRVLRRVRHMTRSAEQIGAQDFSRRLPVTGNDEFSELSETFNGLLGRLETAFTQQERALILQRRFTADASHELKTPLTVIRGNTGMALSGPQDETMYRQALQEIDGAAKTMSQLVHDLLLLARSDGGQLGCNPIELLVREVLERAIPGAARGPRAPIVLTIEGETAHAAGAGRKDPPLSLLGNESELVRLFSNLLDNAVRYTPHDGHITITARRIVRRESHPDLKPNLKLEKGASRETDKNGAEANVETEKAGANGTPQIEITVADTGIGIAAVHLPHLGERFYRAEMSRARPSGGTGLGLSICMSIVEAHQGTMTFASTPGAGTRVTVVFPDASQS